MFVTLDWCAKRGDLFRMMEALRREEEEKSRPLEEAEEGPGMPTPPPADSSAARPCAEGAQSGAEAPTEPPGGGSLEGVSPPRLSSPGWQERASLSIQAERPVSILKQEVGQRSRLVRTPLSGSVSSGTTLSKGLLVRASAECHSS